MTTTVLVHNPHVEVTVVTEDRVWDPEKKVMTDDWAKANLVVVGPGQLHQTYCTNTRRITIVE